MYINKISTKLSLKRLRVDNTFPHLFIEVDSGLITPNFTPTGFSTCAAEIML